MNFLIEKPELMRTPTNIISTGDTHSELSNITSMIIFKYKGKAINVLKPDKRNLTFGRSSNCSIKLADPRFPRVAGEIILGPIPMLRDTKNTPGTKSLIPISPGKPFRIRPYTLTIIDPGEIIYNRNKGKGPIRPRISKMAIFFMIFLMFAVTAYCNLYRYSYKTNHFSLERKEDIFNKIIKGEEHRDSNEIPLEEHVDWISQDPSKSTPKGYAHAMNQANALPVSSMISKKETETASSIKSSIICNNPHITDADLKKIIKAAVLLIEKGDLEMAGKTINPILIHTDSGQREEVVSSLDPLIWLLYRNAYMLKPYEPDKAERILKDIIDSRLEFLPAFTKAQRALQGFRKQGFQ